MLKRWHDQGATRDILDFCIFSRLHFVVTYEERKKVCDAKVKLPNLLISKFEVTTLDWFRIQNHIDNKVYKEGFRLA